MKEVVALWRIDQVSASRGKWKSAMALSMLKNRMMALGLKQERKRNLLIGIKSDINRQMFISKKRLFLEAFVLRGDDLIRRKRYRKAIDRRQAQDER